MRQLPQLRTSPQLSSHGGQVTGATSQMESPSQPRSLHELCWAVLLDQAPLNGYVCGAACYQLPPPQLLELFRTVMDVVRVKNGIFYSCQTKGHLSPEIRFTAQQKARENESILTEFLRHWPEENLCLERLQGLERLAFLQEGHPERDTWTLMQMEQCDLFVHRYAGKRVLENKKQLLSAGCSLLRTFLRLSEEGGRRRLRHLDISARPLSWVELFAVAGMVHDTVAAAAAGDAAVSLGLRMELSEGRRMYARRLLKSGLAGPAGAPHVRLRHVSIVSEAADEAEDRRNLLLAGQLLAAVGGSELDGLSVQVHAAVPAAALAALVRRAPAVRELKLLLPAGAELEDWPALLELVSEQRALRRLELRCALRRRLRPLLAELPGPLTALCLPSCALTVADLEALALWPHLCQLEELDLSDGVDASEEHRQDAAVQHLCVLLAQCEQLRVLVLDGCRVEADQLPQLLRTVRTLHRLERLSFAGCPDRARPDELLRLAADLVSLPRLRLLTLSGFCQEQIAELREDMAYWSEVTGSGGAPLIELRQRRRAAAWEAGSAGTI